MSQPKKTFIDKCFKDKDGKVVLGQAPNWPLYGFIISKLIHTLPLSAPYKNGTDFLTSAFLFTWASLELVQGTNYFRRAIGVVALVILVGSYFM